MTTPFTFGKCKTRAGYSAKLIKQGKLDLKKIKDTFETILETPILLVIKEQGLEIVVHGYGELLFKNGTAGQVELMEKVAKRIYQEGLEK
ncbi:MAG TPA: hypothetical protein VJI32_03275 [Candidatus Nanoarchaeia archaeon]|nr:hypothetical protein [Candidatus Nanoarchaeia archaeon]